MLIVFVTAFSISFMTGFFAIPYAQASGLFMLVALAYLLYRLLIYRSYKYVRARTTDTGT
jgi:hypothetical protein